MGADRFKPGRDDTDVVGSRIGAQLLDLLLIIVLFFVLTFVVGFFGGLIGAIAGTGVGEGITGIGLVFAITLSLAYPFLLEGWWNGQTIGKRVFGIRVVKEDGSDVGYASAFVRNIPAPVAYSLLSYLVALVSMAASDKRQRLFDLVAGTVVVREGYNATGEETAPSPNDRMTVDTSEGGEPSEASTGESGEASTSESEESSERQ